MNDIFKNLKMSDIPQLIFTAGGLIYALGFLTINSYLSNFGFSSIEVVNAKYLTAGLFAAFFLSFIIGISLYLSFNIKSLTVQKRLNRVMIARYIFTFIIATYLFASTLYGIFHSSYSSSSDIDKPVKATFTSNDFITSFINSHLSFMNSAGKFGTLWFIYICAVLLSLYVLFEIIVYISRRFKKSSKKQEDTTLIRNISTASSPSKIKKLLQGVLVAILLSLVLALGVYSFLSVTTFNLSDSITRQESISISEYFSYFYISLGSFMFLFLLLDFEKVKNFHSILKYIYDEPLVTIQTLIIILFSSIYLFSKIIYPSITDTIGGGSPRLIHITSTAFPWMDKNEYKFYLVGETQDSYFILAENNRNKLGSLEVKKDKIDVFWNGDNFVSNNASFSASHK